jgi:hypothetical protein
MQYMRLATDMYVKSIVYQATRCNIKAKLRAPGYICCDNNYYRIQQVMV